jgi:hypothetical protein
LNGPPQLCCVSIPGAIDTPEFAEIVRKRRAGRNLTESPQGLDVNVTNDDFEALRIAAQLQELPPQLPRSG